MARPTSYRLTSYGDMITNQPRTDAYAQALRQAVRPGGTVLDIGAGTGIFSLLACQYGAGHVHAVEPDDAIQVARQMAAANGCSDRITFHQALSTAIALPAPADLIISDLRGVLPLFQHHIPAIADARARLLAPGGVLIPCRDTLWAALVEDEKSYRPYAEPWLRNDYGLDLSAGQPLAVNSWRKVNAQADQLLVTPQQWATLDYATIESPDVAGELAWTVEQPGTAHALLLWFDAELADGIGFSNAPGGPELIYGQAFFPLQTPVALEPGDLVSVQLRANLTGDDYIWQWRTSVRPAAAHAPPKANFRQSTFLGAPLSPASLAKREAGYQPVLDESGQLDRTILALMDGQLSLADIAQRVMEAFPQRFSHWRAALAYAGELSLKYSR